MPRSPHVLAFSLLCLIWGSTWMGIRILVRDVPPLESAAMRFLLAAIMLFLWALVRRSRWPRGEKQWNSILVLSFTIMAVPYGLLFWAEQYVTSSMAAILFSSTPLVVALITPLMLGRTVPRSAVFSLVVAFGGLLLLLYTSFEIGGRALWGSCAIVAAMISSSWSSVYAKTRLQEIDPIVATALQSLFGSILLFWATWALESHRSATWSTQAVVALLFLAAFGSALAFALYYWLLKHMQPYQLASLNLVSPVIAVAEGRVFMLESLPVRSIVAMVIILGSVRAVLHAEAES